MSKTFQSLDHFAIVVGDTDEALKFYRDVLGLTVLFSQVLPDAPIRLTHLETGTPVHLQLVQPLRDDHPLAEWLADHGEGLHHVCFQVPSVAAAMTLLPALGLPFRDKAPRSGPKGRAAAFIDPAATRGVLFEVTSDPPRVL